MVCSNCGYALGADDQFCGGCGAYLTDAPQEETARADDDWGIPFTPEQESAPPPRDNRTLGVIAGVLVGVLALALVIWFLGRDSDDDVADSPATTPVVTDTATDGQTPAEPAEKEATEADPETETATETETPEPTPSEIDLPSSAAQCNNVGSLAVYRGNDQTSCQFAENVARAYAELEEPPTEAFTLSGVSSPVTGQSYDLACDFSTPVRCGGGNNAVIYISPST
ncbi:MAG: zinc ribbon domain-containing protein [Actinomycetia bacterium]|nr:zinc ribbon domain-containing protein [Actinomycetes bacterium]